MYVKVCGITEVEDALAAIAAGADALGFNCIPASKRYLAPERVRDIVAQLRREAPRPVSCVVVVADVAPAVATQLLLELRIDRLQLHGDEPPEVITAIGSRAFKAVRIADAADVARAAAFPGHPVLVDAKVEGLLGGTGRCIDWPLVEPLARARPLILAGGLSPLNVARAVDMVQPWAVDVASGVEVDGNPRRKDLDKMRRFIALARAASREPSTIPF